MSSRAQQSGFESEPESGRPAADERVWLGAKLALLLALVLGAVVFFFHLGASPLWEPDEARYAEIAREMLTGKGLVRFIIPHLNYVPYVEKPPLLYWLTSLAFRLFGLNLFAARLICALSALIATIATFLFTLRAFDRRRALLAAAILATMPLFAVMAQVLTTDMLLTAALTVSFFAFFMHWREGGRWCWLFYLAMALGTLTKGPIAIAVPVVSAVVFLWWQGELGGSVRRFQAIPGFILVFIIAAPWFIAMCFVERGFFNFYFIGEYLRRFFQKNFSHSEPFYFYLPVLAAGLLPWTLVAPFARWRRAEPNPARDYCLIAALVILVVFSAASGKLIPYILPALPPLAVLLADAICGAGDRGGAPMRRLAAAGPLISLLGVAAIAAAALSPLFRSPYPRAVAPALFALGCVVILGAIVFTLLILARRFELGLCALTLMMVAGLIAGTYGRLEAAPLRSYDALSRAVAAKEPDATLICYHRYVQSLAFYCRRRVVLVGPRSELEFGSQHSPAAERYFLDTDAELLRLWREPGPKVLVIGRADLEKLAARLGPVRVIASEAKKRAVVRTAP